MSDIIKEFPVLQDFNVNIEEFKKSCLDPKNQLRHVDKIFSRFGL